jgi:hypothetical protein
MGKKSIMFDDDDMFIVHDNIKIYTGIVRQDYDRYVGNIEFFKSLTKNDIITELSSSTISVTGRISNIDIDDIAIIKQLPAPQCDYIVKIGSNGGVIMNPRHDELTAHLVKKVKKRIVKKKPKKITSRNQNGYFPSAVQFEIFDDPRQRIFKIKLFRNGRIQIPGVKDRNLMDIFGPLQRMRLYLQHALERNVEVMYLCTVMRNYISHLSNKDLAIFIDKVKEIIAKIKTYPIVSTEEMQSLVKELPKVGGRNDLKAIMDLGKSNLVINEMLLDKEKRNELNIKFNRPIKSDPNRQIGVKILQSGKIDFDGNELEVQELYNWVVFLLKANWDTVIYDPDVFEATVSSDSDDYPALYDDELDEADSSSSEDE